MVPGIWDRILSWGRRKPADSPEKTEAQASLGYERRLFVNLPLPTSDLDDHGNPLRTYVPNEVITTKYTLLTFLPKNLFEQFRRVANQYFLFLIILQLIPAVAEGSAGLSALALCFIIFVTSLKDGYEDYKRYQSDAEVNNAETLILRRWTNFNTRRSTLKLNFLQRVQSSLPGAPQPYPVLNRSKSTLRPADDSPGSSQVAASHEKLAMGGGEMDHSSQWSKILWRSLQVGDFVLVRNDQHIPADLLILSTSDEDGLCFIETKNLDGETNLKLRQAMGSTSSWQSVDDLRSTEISVDCEAPNTNLYSFKGSMTNNHRVDPNQSPEFPKVPRAEPITIDNILLRGCILRNTDYVVGLALFTGPESKIVLNSGVTPNKRSRIEKIMNTQVALNFVLLFILCLLCAISSGFLYTQTETSQTLFETNFDTDPDNAAFVGFLTFWSGLILFQNIVPISLYISIELVKTIQAYFIYCDLDMYFPPLDRPCMPKTWNISDDLGQVQYIFSDKTGTLTQNVMEFRQCSIRGTVYGELFDPEAADENEDDGQAQTSEMLPLNPSVYEQGSALLSPSAFFNSSQASQDPSTRSGIIDHGNFPPNQTLQVSTSESHLNMSHISVRSPVDPSLPWGSGKPTFDQTKSLMLHDMQAMFDNPYFDHDDVTFVDVKLFRHLAADGGQARAVVEFFTILAVCHSVLAERPDPDNPNKIIYKAQSPDEAALVSAARNSGFTFLGREQDTIRCEFLGRPQQFKLLNVLEFNSTRKRMSVIVQRSDGRIVLFSKGADSIIFQRLRAGQVEVKETTLEHLKYFATTGLRTLCLGYRIIPDEEYDAWAHDYMEACNLLDGREEAIDDVSEKIEHSLTLVGGTAIEDRLQDGVPEAIAQLACAGLKIWVLTGDKTETAINIGFSCNLLHEGMQLIVVTGTDTTSTQTQLQEALDKFGFEQGRIRGPYSGSHSSGGGIHSGLNPSHGVEEEPGLDAEGNNKPLALIIDGESLKYALEPALEKLFLQVAQMCEAVVCCRVSPLQKALVVRCVKQNLKVLCLAIGDGANDVSMIQEADIGVGIAGEEGLQAVLASDYSIAQFRYLQKLLLVHGRWSYIRVANMIMIFFYKNIIWTFALFWFQLWCGFSLTFLFDYALMMFYNLAFTSIPVLVLGVLDQDVAADVSMAVPQLYMGGIKGTEFNMRRFWMHIFDGIYQSLVCVLIPFYVYNLTASAHSSGLDDTELNEVGTIISIGVVCAANLYVALNTMNWTWIIPVVVTLSTLSLSLFLGIYCQLDVSALYHMDVQIYTQGNFYFVLAIVLILCMLPRFFIKFISQTFFPSDADIVREVVHLYSRLYSRPSPTPDSVRDSCRATANGPDREPVGHSAHSLIRKKSAPLSPQCIPLTAPQAMVADTPDSISIHRGTTPPGSHVGLPGLVGYSPHLSHMSPASGGDRRSSVAAYPDDDMGEQSDPALINQLRRMSTITSLHPSIRRQRTTKHRGPFRSAMHKLKEKTLYFMKSGKSQPNTGFAYSQHHQSSLSIRYSYAPSVRSMNRSNPSSGDRPSAPRL
ncbi:phospholipid transporting ATPase [Dimargaris cristalligena]|nr:phospholipid transporting ATPase [Dimargaris cristalligena]